MSKKQAPEGARVEILVTYGEEVFVLPLHEAAKIGQILSGMTALLTRDAYILAEGQPVGIPAKPRRQAPQSYMVPMQAGRDEEPQG